MLLLGRSIPRKRNNSPSPWLPIPRQGRRPLPAFVPISWSLTRISLLRLKTPEQVAKDPLGDLPDIDDFAAPPKRSTLPTPGGEIPQLVLKAIFGVSEEMDRNEILRRARALPNIKSVNLVGRPESEAIAVLQKSIGALGLGDEPLTLRVGDSDIDFIREEGVTLAVLTNGGYAAGIRETLIIVARELARLV